jgi:hypothetical protein
MYYILNKQIEIMVKNINLLDENVDKILSNSNYRILDFKYNLNKLYEIILEFCSKNNIIISNSNINISIIKNINFKLNDINNDFQFLLLSQSPKKDATKLLDILFEKYSKYVFFSSYVNDKELVISIDNNRIIYFNLLFSNDLNIIVSDKFNMIDYNYIGNSGSFNLKILPNEILLMFLSHNLYTPSIFLDIVKSDNIKSKTISKKEFYIPVDGLDNIERYNILIKELTNTKNGAKFSIVNSPNKIKNKILLNFFKIILNEQHPQKIILLDSHCIKMMSILFNQNIKNSEKFNEILNSLNFYNTINFITSLSSKSNKFNLIQYFINIFKEILKENNIQYKKILYTISNIYLYDDFRLKKTNIFIILENDIKISLLNLFNSIDYELIPIVTKYKNILIPHDFVITRFLLVNLISIQLYDKFSNIHIFNNYMNIIKSLHDLNLNYTNIYYTGIYRDEKIDKFKMGSYVYRPWQKYIRDDKLVVESNDDN